MIAPSALAENGFDAAVTPGRAAAGSTVAAAVRRRIQAAAMSFRPGHPEDSPRCRSSARPPATRGTWNIAAGSPRTYACPAEGWPGERKESMGSYRGIVGRDQELAVLSAAVAGAAAGRGQPGAGGGGRGDRQDNLVAGRLRNPAAPGGRVLTARGLALEARLLLRHRPPAPRACPRRRRAEASGTGYWTAQPGWPRGYSTGPRRDRSRTMSRTR